MNGNIRLGRLGSIPFYINASWFLILGLVTWVYGSGLAAGFPQLTGLAPWGLGLLTALLVFASVLAHELGHSWVALRQGIGVKSITLFLFGGLASLERESKTPWEALAVAIAGPAVSLLLWGAFTLLGLTLPISGSALAIVSLLATINLFLALFNLIPGLPLDGGNVLKAIIWKVTGNPYKGTQVAGRVGQIFGWLAVASGMLPLVLYGSFGNIWNLLIGWFLLQNAGFSAQSATVQEQLSQYTAADAVGENSPIIAADQSLRDLADATVLSNKTWSRFLVTNAEGQLIGAIALQDLKTIPSAQWATTQVRDLMQAMTQPRTVESTQSLLDVVGLFDQEQLPALAVVRENGALVGLLEKASILRFLQGRTQTKPA
ncbi:CBS domain-containing protein [Synechococcales cyanobacterium C]|uniref:Zinc metalloprotease n=1 Tax=Petrachloros mirabilis ULC683 TaxID=2781853 RepID=A0A8K2ABS4_9CYAN|nr:site-2 protease family protein [Petrachloros mirabilis]NCJ05025.1 CBS domain-containing protein [Petrachloros mirabilis ULC683]